MAILAEAGHQNRPGKTLAEVHINTTDAELIGDLTLPPDARGLVIFVHGSGSSRHSPRNAYVAHLLNEARLGTLLFDLLTGQEGGDRANVFDIELLAGRLVATTRWVRRQPWSAGLPIGWFGASTGSAAALWAAGKPHADVTAIVSRGGRPDLAASRLSQVQAPTLLIVGGNDPQVLRLNEQAAALMTCPHEVMVVPGASHLFEEPGTLETAATLARDWFAQHLLRPATAPAG
ncbi:dienelactone hydrolase family protein [Catelliglobosispora koreensis]|uniref:dienelactone hydrolase family protein n=1 Tax=Catelliglobosispora koreensis TaxID=129052 RepID=UPI0038991C04